MLQSLRNTVEISAVELFLHRHVVDVPPLSRLAAMASMSRSHFSRVFHAVTGKTIRAYVRAIRLQRAEFLLRDPSRSITTVALECGFYDLPHFNKAFRRHYGISPRDFRRRSAGTRRPRAS